MKKISIFLFPFFALFLYAGNNSRTCFELLLIDTEGKMVGYDRTSGKIVEEIPESWYGDIFIPNLEGEDIFSRKSLEVIKPSKGKYVLYVVGVDTGPFAVRMETRDKDGNYKIFFTSGAISPGEIKKIFIDYTPEVGGITHIFEDDTPPVTDIEVGGPKFEVFGVNYISKSTKICFNSTDPIVVEGASGVKYTEYRIDNSSWVVYTVALLDCSVTSNSVTLTWTAVGDDGNIGQAIRYDIRYSTQSILTDEDFDKATQVEVDLQPKPSGEKETFTVGGLQQGTEYYFAIKVIDDANNISELSNCVFARTLLDVPYFCQADPQWRGIPHLRPRDVQTENTIGKVGCALTSMAMIINYYADYHPDENMRNKIVKRNPLELNDLLVENKWYAKNNDIDFRYIVKVSSGSIMMTKEEEPPTDNTVNGYLKNKMPIILKVYNEKTSNSHFVVVTGSCVPLGYTINDPGYKDNKNLGKYGNKYQDLRRFKPSDGNDNYSALSIRGYPGRKK